MTIYKKIFKQKVILNLLLIFFFLLVTNSFSQKKETLKVMSFNIHYGVTNEGVFDINEAVKVINSIQPDIVMLQEVDKKTERALKKDLATELGFKTKMTPIFGKSIAYQGGQYGNAILTNFPVLKSEVHLLPFEEGTEQRSALEVILNLNSGAKIRVISTHFDHSKSNGLRVQQANFINQKFNDEIPSLLAGDLNALPEDNAIHTLLDSWEMSFNKKCLSFPSDKPRIKIDYILNKPSNKWKVVKTKMIKDNNTSDHFPLVVKIKYLHLK